MDYKKVQRQLDISAEEMDGASHADLADKVDQCNVKLEKATAEERKVIASVLEKIDKEFELRKTKAVKGTKDSPNRLAATRRKEGTRARIETIKANIKARKLERELLDGLELHEASSERNKESLRQWRTDRVKKAKVASLKRQIAELEAEETAE